MGETVKSDSTEARKGLLLSLAKQWLTAGLDLLYPPRCAGCGQVDSKWCARCQQDITNLPFFDRLTTLPPLAGSAATAIHEGKVQQAIHALKYENARFLAIPLGTRLADCLRQQAWQIDRIVPVPLHIQRRQTRGYNQAQLLGETIAAQHNLPCAPEAISRIRDTATQVGLNRSQRQVNVAGAFVANPALVANQRLLLIDDVFTTGATLQACAQAALDAGAAAVYSLTLTTARL